MNTTKLLLGFLTVSIIGFFGYIATVSDYVQTASVGAVSAPCSISASANTIQAGEAVTLSWTSAPSSTKHWLYGIYPDKNGRAVSSDGSIVVTPAKTTPYTLRVELGGIVSSCDVRITVSQGTTPTSQLPCTFNSATVAHGATVTAYQAGSVPAGNTCVSETRTCTNGTLSGTYTFESCTGEALSLGQTNDGTPILGKVTSVDRITYPTRTTVYWDNQDIYKEIPVGAHVYINNRIFSIHIDSHVGNIYLPVNTAVSVGDTVAIRGVSAIVLPAPVVSPTPVVPSTPPAPAVLSCVFNGNTVAHGATVTAYQAASVPTGSTCVSQVRTCTNGTLSGTHAFGSCSISAPSTCVFNGTTVNHGGTVIAYQAASVPTGNTCVSETRTCTNGTLSGTYTFGSCNVVAPTGASCTASVKVVELKEGVTGPAHRYATATEIAPFRDAILTPQVITNAQAVTWYTKPYSQNGASCASLKVVRTCDNGTLSGNNALRYYSACVDLPTTSTASHHPQRSDRPLSARGDSELLGLAFMQFNANKVVWTYARNMQKQGLAFPIQATLPGGRTTVPAETCSGSVSGSGPNADISSPSWRTSMLDFVKPKINDGIYSFQQDDPSSVFRACASPNEINEFLRWFHDSLRSYAQTVDPGSTLTFSSNFTTYELSSSWIYQEYDFIESEVFAESGQSILTALRQLHPVYKTFSYPSIITIRSSNVLHNQRGIAQSYAFGVLPIIPWDVFFNFGPRYYGSPANFADYYKLVKDNPAVFDDYPMVELADINSSAVQITGTSGDTFIRKHQTQANKKTVHVVRSVATPVTMKVTLNASVFTNLPNAYITPAQTTPVAITPVLTNGRYEYTIPNAPLWTVLIYK